MSTSNDKAVGTERQYFEQLAAGRFMIQRCAHCHQHVFPPREFCVHCGDDALDWIEPSGLGTVYSHTTVARKPDTGGDYNIVLIDLREGPRLMSTVIDQKSGPLRVGMTVQARVEHNESGSRLVFTGVQA